MCIVFLTTIKLFLIIQFGKVFFLLIKGSYFWTWWDLLLLLVVPGLIPILSSKSFLLTKWSGLGMPLPYMTWCWLPNWFKPSVISLIAIDIVSIDPSVLDQLSEGFLHLDNDLEEFVVCLELISSLDWLLFCNNATVDSFPLLL